MRYPLHAGLVTAAGLALAISAPAATTAHKAAPAKATATKPAGSPNPMAGTGSVTRAQMIAYVKQVFARADTNHDGFMSRPEFAARMGVIVNNAQPDSKAEAQKMLDAANAAFDHVDANHDGKLSLAEAMARPLSAFDMMDTNHDGILTAAEKKAARANAPSVTNGPSPDGPAPQGH